MGQSTTSKPVRVILDQPLLFKNVYEENFDLIKQTLSFLGLTTTEELIRVRFSVTWRFATLVSQVLENLLKENYTAHPEVLKGKTHIRQSVYDKHGSKTAPWDGVYCLEDKQKHKLVASVTLDAKSRWLPGSVSIYVPCVKQELAFKFFQGIEQGISNIKKTVFNGHGEFLEMRDSPQWSDVILPDDIVKTIKRSVIDFLHKREIFERRGVIFRRGILIYGPPGNGKSLIGRLLSTQADANFIWVSPRDLHDPDDVSDVFALGRALSPTVLFLEDLDMVGGQDRFGSSFKALLGQLLNELDGANNNDGLIVVGTTNALNELDKAAVRPGRFDIKLEIQNPDHDRRTGILKLYSSKIVLGEDVDFNHISKMVEGFSCAGLRELINQAQMISLEEEPQTEKLQMKYLIQAATIMGAKKQVMGFVTPESIKPDGEKI